MLPCQAHERRLELDINHSNPLISPQHPDHSHLSFHSWPISLDATFHSLSSVTLLLSFAAGQLIILFKMQYPSFGHFLLASILAVQGVQSLNLVSTGQVARRFVVSWMPS